VLFAGLLWKRGGAMPHGPMLLLAVGSPAAYGRVAFCCSDGEASCYFSAGAGSIVAVDWRGGPAFR
jgi:hypothetical protein